MEEMRGPQRRLCLKINLLWSNLNTSCWSGYELFSLPSYEAVENGQLVVSSKKVLQLNDGICLSTKILFLEKYHSNRIFRFKISKTFSLFITYTLAGTAEDITKLSPTLFPINTTFPSTDFVAAASAIDYEPIEDRNLNAILATLATSSLYNERVRTFIDSQITYTSTESSGIQPSDTPHLLHNSFLVLLSNIFSPFVNGILAFLTILALAWGFILTIVTCRCAFLIGKRRYSRAPHDRWNHYRNRFLHASNNHADQPQNQEAIELRDLSNCGASNEQA